MPTLQFGVSVRRRVAIAWALALAGCAATPQPSMLRIEGRLEAPAAGRQDAPTDWVVELRDDSADRVLAEQRGRLAALQPTIPFVLSIDPARLDPTHRHSVRGALSVQGQVRWLSAARPVDVSRPAAIDIGSLRLEPHVSPGAFASTLDCGGQRMTLGHIGERLRLSGGPQVHDLTRVPGSRPQRYERPADPATFVELDDAGATISLQGRRLPRCTAVAPLR